MAYEIVPCALGGPIDDVTDEVFEADYEKKLGEGSGYVELALRAVDTSSGAVLGACTAEYWYGGLIITRLVVEPGSRRRRGVGSALLLAALEAGAAKGALVATVQTFAHQAPDFYPRFGFKELFRRHGYGAARTFFYFVRQYAAGEEFPRPASLEACIAIEAVAGGATPEVLAFCRANFDQHGMEVLGDTARVTRFAFAALPPELAAEARAAAAAAAATPTTAAAGQSTGVSSAPAAVAAESSASSPAGLLTAGSAAGPLSGGSTAVSAPPGPAVAPLPTVPLPAATKILGTIEGLSYWGGMHVKYLVVREEARGKGIGNALLAAAEAEAARQGNNLIALETMSYQVRNAGECIDARGLYWQSGAREPPMRLFRSMPIVALRLLGSAVLLSPLQVPAFYAARGYKLDGTAGGWKGGAAMHYFSKLLRPESLHGGPFVEPADPAILPVPSAGAADSRVASAQGIVEAAARAPSA